MLAQFLADSGTQPAQNLSIADRQLILQLVGFGYYVLPELRVMLSLQLVELVGGGPAGASPLALVGIIPWLGWHPGGGPFFVGIGPLFAPRSYGQDEVDLGIFTAAGVAFPLGAGFSAGAAVQLPPHVAAARGLLDRARGLPGIPILSRRDAWRRCNGEKE
ncbi:MAG: hypothetical protein M5U28_14725 [Sandaracinaceae bacterium]|nr:hypothetical protein [Sandaracinaceae bacterium]